MANDGGARARLGTNAIAIAWTTQTIKQYSVFRNVLCMEGFLCGRKYIITRSC
jgi:hypothetical protein